MASATQNNPSMNWSAPNLHTEWKRFQQHAELMFQGPLNKQTEAGKCAFLLIWVGDQGREIFNAWNMHADDAAKLDRVMARFQAHTQPRKNTVFARYIFQERKQKPDEPLDTFVTDLRNLVKDCSYDKPDEMVRDRIVSGITSQDLREKLLTEGDGLTMDKAIEIAHCHETTKQHLQSMAASGANVDAIHKPRKHSKLQRGQGVTDHPSSSSYPCRNCGGKHGKKECPAFGKECHFCKKRNHYEKMCLSKRKRGEHHRSSGVHTVETEEHYDDLYIDTISGGRDQPDTAYANITVGENDSIRFKVDTGAQANIIPKSLYDKMNMPPPIQKCSHRLRSYTGQPLKNVGCVKLHVTYKNSSYHGYFCIVDTVSQPIIGLQASLELKLIELILSVDQVAMDRESVLSEYNQLFSGLGTLDGEVNIHLKADATPVVHPPRRVPHSLRDKLQEELHTMEKAGVIARVTDPTDWVNSLVVVEKPNGKIRVCLDPKDLNEAVKRPHYNMPTLEDALAKISGAKYFSKLDAKSGYWQMKLSEKSSFFTTFNSPFGRYRFLRMPFGLVSAQDEFQRKMEEVFEGLDGIAVLVDDILVTGKTTEEHDRHLRDALNRGAAKGLKLNADKLTVGAQEVDYFGHILSSEGLKPDPGKVKAIMNMTAPANKKELQTLLGMVTYLAKFASSQLSEVTKPMRDLLKVDVEFQWDTIQQQAFEKTKEILSKQPVLAYFDPAKPITLQVDASKHGLGATILQDGKPVAFASKSLNQTEQQYAQVEKELYAIVFGCERFHQYIYGRNRVQVQSDHKPLESVMKKPLAAAPPRLQRMLLRLQKYSIQVIHVPGKNIPVADTLSRKSLPPTPEDNRLSDDLVSVIHSIMSSLPVSDRKMADLKEATKQDHTLQHTKQYILDGWPETRQECHSSAINLWNHRDELTMMDGIIFKGGKIFVPGSLRPVMLEKIHTSHLGMEKCKQRARDIVFWPGMSADIETMVQRCETCQSRQHSNPKEPLTPHEIPTRPWQKVGTDLFQWDGKNYLVTVDYYSRFFEVDQLDTTTSKAIIRKLSSHFARHGIPEVVMSDNGPQFSADEFQSFAESWDFQHITSSPKYPQSNGLAEKSVQTCKRILDKAKSSGTNPILCLLEYRTTPVDNLASPAQLLMGRRLRSILPTTSQHLQPEPPKPSEVQKTRIAHQQRQKAYYDRTAQALPPLKSGDRVTVQQENGRWQPASVTKAATQRSYVVKTPEGQILRRNRRHLRRAPNPPESLRLPGPPSTPGLPCPPGTPRSPGLPCSTGQSSTGTPPAQQQPARSAPTSSTAEAPVITRSGREVKPPNRLDM